MITWLSSHRATAARLLPVLSLALLLGLPAFLLPALAAADGEVNVYSARQEELIKPLLDRFSEETGIEVNLVTGRADELVQRLRSEGANTPADILLTVDAGNLHRAKAAELTQPIASEMIEAAVPDNYRDPEGHWVGLSMRARPIMYHIGEVDPADLSTYEDLVDEKWRGRICIRSSSHVYNQSLVGSMLAAQGTEATEEWARGLVANMARPPVGGDRDQIRAAAAGECDLAIANTYYVAGMLKSGDPAEVAAAEQIGIFWPNQPGSGDGRGTHVNVSGAALIKASRNTDNAVRLIEYLTSPEAQAWYAEVNGEYPVHPDVEPSPELVAWGDFKADTINLARLGELNAEAVMLMDRAGWR